MENIPMSDSKTTETEEDVNTNMLDELSIQNLKALRYCMHDLYRESLDIADTYEYHDYRKHLMFETIREHTPFLEDGEDQGVKEDYELLGIK